MYLALRAFQDLNWHSRNTIHVTESSQKIITFESMKSARHVGEILAQSRVSRHTAHVASGVPPGGGRERGSTRLALAENKHEIIGRQPHAPRSGHTLRRPHRRLLSNGGHPRTHPEIEAFVESIRLGGVRTVDHERTVDARTPSGASKRDAPAKVPR